MNDLLNGIIIVNKPQGWTSFDVCNKIRGLTGVKKVGHSGTLDPMATGVLPVFLGTATKSVDRFLSGDKGYRAEMTLGITTDTLDATGKILLRNAECGVRNEEEIKSLFEKYTGKLKQKPPMFSAKKVNGQRLYKMARKGQEVEREPVEITIYKIDLLGMDGNKIRFDVLCSKGTYVRVLAADMGDDLGCGAHLSALERIYSHPFHISQAFDLNTIANLVKIGRLDTIILPVADILAA
ncbi:MAG TPA: tRNA pseudouridine(55) synthase TruB [Candidatus Omnitrophota bacterium]|nr:tRNA pseudouridine(55) synthase TruB [Candidatus Omnitrophota bacterium]